MGTLKFLVRPIIGLIAVARAVGYSCMMLFVLLNPGILGAVHGDSALEIGLWNLPFSFSTFLISVGLIGYGWTIEWNQWVGMIFSVLIGIGVCANRPGYLSYAMQENPTNAAAVTGATIFFSMLLTFPLSVFGPITAQRIGIPALFSLCGCVTFGCAIPTIIIMGLNMSKQP